MKKKLELKNHQKAVILQSNYDDIFDRSGECKICLTKQQIAWIISQSDYAAWPTRWYSSGEMDAVRLAEFQADLIRRLMVICEECEDGMYALRQNEENPCQLEQSTDGGATWSLAFDYSLCMAQWDIDQTLNPPETRYNEETAHIQRSTDGGTTWVDVPDGRDTTPLTPNPYPDDTACWNTANVVAAIEEIIENSGDNAIEVATGIASLAAKVLIVLPAAWIISIVTGAIALAGILVARSQMDAAAYDDLREILYCSHDQPGGWSRDAFFSVISQCAARFPFPSSVFVTGILQLLGAQGLSNAGHLHLVESVDCSGISCGACEAEFDIGQVSGGTAYGVFLGVVDGKFRYQSEDNGAGYHLLTIMSAGVDQCCSIQSFNVVSGSIDAYFHINCGSPQEAVHVAPDWAIGVPYNYISAQKASTGFTVDIEFF